MHVAVSAYKVSWSKPQMYFPTTYNCSVSGAWSQSTEWVVVDHGRSQFTVGPTQRQRFTIHTYWQYGYQKIFSLAWIRGRRWSTQRTLTVAVSWRWNPLHSCTLRPMWYLLIRVEISRCHPWNVSCNPDIVTLVEVSSLFILRSHFNGYHWQLSLFITFSTFLVCSNRCRTSWMIEMRACFLFFKIIFMML